MQCAMLWFPGILGLVQASFNLWNQLTDEAGTAVSQQETESVSLICSRRVWVELVRTLDGFLWSWK